MRINGTRSLAPIGAALSILALLFAAVSRYGCAFPPRFLFLPTFIASLVVCLAAAIIMLFEGKRTGKYAGKKYIVLGFCVNGFLIVTLLIITHARAQTMACVENLKGIDAALKAYASKNADTLPPIDNLKNNFIFDANVLYPEYMNNVSVLLCPSDVDFRPKKAFRLRAKKYHPDSSIGDVHPDCVTGDSYCYLGWVLTSDVEAEAFFEVYDRLSPDEYGKDIRVSKGSGNPLGELLDPDHIVHSDMIYRLNTRVDWKMTTTVIGSHVRWDVEIPVIWDNIGQSGPRHKSPYRSESPGALVLYLDGHVEFIRFGERFPITETMARLLDERRREPIPDCGD